MWKAYPEVLGLDNTYKTNRFKMYLFQITGMTDMMTVVNFGFGLINSEKEPAYLWLLQQLNALRGQIGGISEPRVIITDKETALKNALSQVFPGAQQQLCVWHINANVRAKIRSRWKEANSPTDPAAQFNDAAAQDLVWDATQTEPTSLQSELASPTDTDFDLAAAADRRAEALPHAQSSQMNPPSAHTDPTDSREAMFEAWRLVVYAPSEEEFESA